MGIEATLRLVAADEPPLSGFREMAGNVTDARRACEQTLSANAIEKTGAQPADAGS